MSLIRTQEQFKLKLEFIQFLIILYLKSKFIQKEFDFIVKVKLYLQSTIYNSNNSNNKSSIVRTKTNYLIRNFKFKITIFVFKT